MQPRKFRLAALALALLLCASACSQNTNGTPAAENPFSLKTEVPEDSPAPTQPADTPEPEPADTDVRPSIAPEDMVRTAYTEQVDMPGGISYVFTVPEFTSTAPDLLYASAEIRSICSKYIDDAKESAAIGDSFVPCGGVDYDFYCGDGIHGSLCLTLYMYPDASGYNDYMVYTVNYGTQELMTDKEIYSLCGYSAQSYQEALFYALGNYFWVIYGSAVGNDDSDEWYEFLLERFAYTISDENLLRCQPFLNNDGDLCVAAWVGSIAGGSEYPYLINVQSPAESPYYQEIMAALS